MTLLKLRYFPRNFVTCSKDIFRRTSFPKHLFLDTRFIVNYFLMNWISQSFNISNFITSRSQVFDHLGVLKNFSRKIHMKKLVLKSVFNKFQASNVQLATFITKETSAQVFFFVGFAKLLRIHFS